MAFSSGNTVIGDKQDDLTSKFGTDAWHAYSSGHIIYVNRDLEKLARDDPHHPEVYRIAVVGGKINFEQVADPAKARMLAYEVVEAEFRAMQHRGIKK